MKRIYVNRNMNNKRIRYILGGTKLKKLLSLFVIALLTISMVVGCTANEEKPDENGENNQKVMVNIEGIVEAVDDSLITLDSGKKVTITGETQFQDDPDNGTEAVNSEIKVGNIIQGYTEDDVNNENVVASVIYKNYASDQLLVKFELDFDGVVNDGMKEAGIVSLEKLFDYEDGVWYVAHIENGVEIETAFQKVEGLPKVLLVKFDGYISIDDPDLNNSIDDSVEITDSFIGVIEEIDGNNAIVLPNEGEEIRASGDKVSIVLADNHEFVVGDKVSVFYDGDIMESYPLQVNTVLVEKYQENNKNYSDNATSDVSEEIVVCE